VKDLLAKANEANLVLNPTNSKFVSAICCCCGCCCGILKGLKYASKPSEAVASQFIAELDSSICIGCLKCVGRCQMEAVTSDEGQARLNKDRCIGCGLCVSTCPSGALSLVRKPNSFQKMPETFFETWRTITSQRHGAHP
jgi:electron transport complex protein RnfB